MQHAVGADQARPAFRIVRLRLQPRGQAIDHGADEGRLLSALRGRSLIRRRLNRVELACPGDLVDLGLQLRAARILRRQAGQQLPPSRESRVQPPGRDVGAGQEVARLHRGGVQLQGTAEGVGGRVADLPLALLDQGHAERGPDLGVSGVQVDRLLQMADGRGQVAPSALDQAEVVERLRIVGFGLGVAGQDGVHLRQAEVRRVGARDGLPALQPRLVGHVRQSRRAGQQIGDERHDGRGDSRRQHQAAGDTRGKARALIARMLGLAQQPAAGLGARGLALLPAQQPALGEIVELGELAAIDLDRGIGRGGAPSRPRRARQDEQGRPARDQAGKDPEQQHGRCVSA